MPAIVWFRLDLRFADHEALVNAVSRHDVVIPVFIWAPEEEAPWQPGGASRWWLHQSLKKLGAALESMGSRVIIRHGPTQAALTNLARESGATAIYWNRRYEPALIERDRDLKQNLKATGITVESFPGNLLFEPWTLANKSGKPFQVFTPFWKACQAMPAPPEPKPAPTQIPAPTKWPASLEVEDLGLEPKINWTQGFGATWQPGEHTASKILKTFLAKSVADYHTERDLPAHQGTSRLSPHLHFGEISARQIWHLAKTNKKAEPYLRQIAWREFAHHLLYHFPNTPHEPLRTDFRAFPWRIDGNSLTAWIKGQTGYPLVDAGMRELWHTGWMHNRVRMLVGSFLVKHLLIPWQEGAAWFWDTLVDADLANNTLGWQWIAGCGADAAPYFRIFNPILQGEKFDPQGAYVRRWIPELANVPSDWIHQPWTAPPLVLSEAGVELGKTYPLPIVNHESARTRALAALASIKTESN